MHPKHDEDFYAWAMEEANLLRQRRLNELDIDNLIEELESMGASEKREIRSRMEQLLKHLLKWQFQSDLQCRSWKNSIRHQRKALLAVVKDNPSLRPTISEYIKDAYKNALEDAVEETGLYKQTFPVECPYTFEQIMDEAFFPE